MPGAGINFCFVFMFVALNCHYHMCLVGNFYGRFIFKTNRFYHFYLHKSCLNLLQCLPLPLREALCLCTTAGVWVISLFGHVLFSNMHQELSGAGLVMSCLEKEGSSLPRVTEKQNVVILTESEMDLLPLSRHRGCYDW